MRWFKHQHRPEDVFPIHSRTFSYAMFSISDIKSAPIYGIKLIDNMSEVMAIHRNPNRQQVRCFWRKDSTHFTREKNYNIAWKKIKVLRSNNKDKYWEDWNLLLVQLFRKMPYLTTSEIILLAKYLLNFDRVKHQKIAVILHFRKGVNMYELDALTVLSTCCTREEIKEMFIKTMIKFPSLNRQLSDYWPLEY